MLSKRILVLMFLIVFLSLIGCFPSPAPPIDENQAPVIISDPVITATVGIEYIYNVEATDPDEDSLTYAFVEGPEGMTIDTTTGVISWIPKCNQVGAHLVVVGVLDGDLGDTQSFIIMVKKPDLPPVPVNHAPIVIFILEGTAEIGVEYTYAVEASDEDGDILTYSLTVNPNGMIIDPDTGVISWIPNSLQVGANDVTVKVSDGEKNATQSFVVVVKPFPIIIDGVLDLNEWNKATNIFITTGMGVVKVLATADCLYVSFDTVDSTDARLGQNIKGNDQTSINVNPTDLGPWGFPYDLIFETSADLPWNPKDNSGIIDGWNTRWFPNDAQEDLPGNLESATIYSGTNRVTEWKLPLDSIPGEVLKVGGAIEVGDGNSYVYPAGLVWDFGSTFVNILVY